METRLTETDPRFPTGKWVGFYMHRGHPRRFPTELLMQFRAGKLLGTGSDYVGRFDVHGIYRLETGECVWLKRYLGKHTVHYRGFNEGNGIWGTWTIAIPGEECRGGFQIWPVGSGPGADGRLREELELPGELESEPLLEPALV